MRGVGRPTVDDAVEIGRAIVATGGENGRSLTFEGIGRSRLVP